MHVIYFNIKIKLSTDMKYEKNKQISIFAYIMYMYK